MLKEYSFSPSASDVVVGEGASVSVTFVATRVAYVLAASCSCPIAGRVILCALQLMMICGVCGCVGVCLDWVPSLVCDLLAPRSPHPVPFPSPPPPSAPLF
jgi:hypothetical protein